MSTQQSTPSIGLIWAQTTAGVIGAGGVLPWHLPEDLAHFKRTTQGHPVVMGRRTWESFPDRFRPLPDRTNIVISRQADLKPALEAAGAVVVGSLAEALAAAQTSPGGEEIWIIGGGQIFDASLSLADTASVTIIDAEIAGDTYAPGLDAGWRLGEADPAGGGWQESKKGLRFRIETWRRS
jgi:dihydrofolate reductase